MSQALKHTGAGDWAMDTDTIVNMHAALRTMYPLLEKRRRKYRRFLIAGVIVIVMAAASWVLLTPYSRFSMPLAATIAGALIPSVIYYQILSHFYRSGGKKRFLDELSRSMKFTYKPDGLFKMSAVSAHKIIPSCNRESVEDGFEGTYKGIRMSVQEVLLEDLQRGKKKKQERELHVFHGLFIRLQVEKAFGGHTVVMPDNGLQTWFRTKFSDFEKINLVAPRFERLYDVMSTDQVEARVLMNPAFIERFMQAGELMRASWMEVSFLSNEILIAVARNRRLFEFDPFWQKVTAERLHKMVEDIEIVMQVIDVLKLNRQAGL